MKKNNLASTFTAAIIAMLSAQGTAHARGAEGHGGRVWICKENGNTTYQLLDFYLAQSTENGGLGLHLDFKGAQTEEEALNVMLGRLEKVEPSRAELYRKRIANFENRSEKEKVVSYLVLGDVKKKIKNSENCETKQVVFSRDLDQVPAVQAGIKFSIAEPLYRELPPIDRAGLKLHEITYEDSTYQGVEYADATMELTAWLASSEMDFVTPELWREKLLNWKLGYHQGQYLVVPQSGVFIKFTDNSQILLPIETIDAEKNRVDLGFTQVRVSSMNSIIRDDYKFNYRDNEFDAIKFWDIVEFDLEGRLKRFRAGQGEIISSEMKFERPQLIWLDDTGRYATVLGLDESSSGKESKIEIEKKVGDLQKNFLGSKQVILNREGQVLMTVLKRKTKLQTNGEHEETFGKGQPIYLDGQGRVIKNGIFSTYSGQYISVPKVGRDALAFELCDLDGDQSTCRQLGPKSAYPKKDLGKLKTSFRVRKLSKGGESITNNVAWHIPFIATGIASALAEKWGASLAVQNAIGYAGLGTWIALPFLLYQYDIHMAHSRARNKMVKSRYWVTHYSMNALVSDINFGLQNLESSRD